MASSIYITHVDKEGPFLKIWGQTERSLSVYVEKSLQQLLPQFEQGLYTPAQGSVQIGVLCCAKYKDGLFYRARITNIINQNAVEVHFIDFGNKDIVPVINIRTMTNVTATLLSVPSQAKEFILSGVMHRGQMWDDNVLALLNNEIRYIELQWGPVGTVGNYTLIKLYRNGEDVTINFIARGLVSSVTVTSQQQILHNFSNSVPPLHSPIASMNAIPSVQMLPPSQPTPQPTLLTYKLSTLEPGSEHDVYVSYVSDGPCHFSLQLQKWEDTLTRLMKEINRMPLQPLEDDPLPGTVCVARCTEDNHICRAVVTSVVDNMFKVFYVDFGNTELLSVDNLYQIPFKFVIPKVMAMRFALAGLDRSSVTLEMKCAFKDFVKEKLLHMRVLPAPARSALPLCELWDQNNINVLDVIRRAALVAYPEPVQLTRGFSQDIHVSYVYSCNRFYVQLKSKEEDLRRVMAELQINCPHKPQLRIDQIKVGQPCCALFEADGLWYRAEVRKIDGNMIEVHYVDYGNDEKVPLQNLRIPQGELLTVLRPQALECCLNGYQKMEADSERDSFLEELVLEKDFTMKVVEMQGNKALIELTDASRYNVASLLLDKIATAHSQASPLLIQDGHKIEQRKRSSPTIAPYHGKQRDDKPFDRSRMRKPFGNKDESNRGSWGQHKENSDKILNSSDNWSSTSSNDNFSEGKTDWRQRKPPPRGGRNNPKRDFSKSDGSQEDSWGGGDASITKNMFNRNKENKLTNSWSGGSDKFAKGKGVRDGWGGQDKGKRDNWGSQDKGNRNSWDSQDRGTRNGWGSADKGHRDKWNSQEKENNKFGRNSKRPSFRENHIKGTPPRSPNFSDKSFSDGSEKNWRNRPRTSSRNDEGNGRGQGKGQFGKGKPSWNLSSGEKSWSASTVSSVSKPPLDLAPPTASFGILDVSNKTELVSVCWFYDPAHFFCQLDNSKDQFRTMMEEIQSRYQNEPPGSGLNISIGSPVIAIFPEDNVLYRARVIELKGARWRVQYVDFGNVMTTDKIWPIEKKFMEMPAQAICCGLALSPVADAWPEPDLFSSYFDKDSYTCNFSEFDNEKYIVELYDNCVNVAELLINASLAKSLESSFGYLEPKYPSVAEIPLLLGQQIRVTLSNVNSLDDFKVILPNGQELQCSLYNLSFAEQKWEDTLKQIVGYTVIIYIDNIIEEKLEVTIYDHAGDKLKLIEPDNGAFDFVECPCPMPILTSTIVGWVSHFTPTSIYIQPSDFIDAINQLLDLLFNTYDNTMLEMPIQPEEKFIYAVHSSDGNWYRGKVISIEGEQVTILFLDYGNTESVNVSELRDLSSELMDLHMLAQEIILSKPLEQLPDTEVSINVWFGEEGWEGEFTTLTEDVVHPSLQESTESQTYDDQKLEESQESIQTEDLQLQSDNSMQLIGIPIVLSHIDTPNEFYIQLLESLDQIDALQESLQDQIPNLQDLENPTAGVLCAAQYSLDQIWYRCQVLDADADITSVRFIDCGNTDVIDNTTTKVKTLPPDLLSLEQYAQRCSLCVKPKDDEWSQVALDRFEQLTSLGNLSMKIIYQDEKTTYVELYANGENVTEKLLVEELAEEIKLEIESSSTGFISHLNSPSEFWIQLENSVGDLEWIAEQLSNAENFPELEDLAPGSLCAALFPEDEMWYRARILSNTVAGLEVIFIDYGNSCTCSGLRQLPEDLILLPPLALKCSLNKPKGIIQWSPQATEKFKEISADGATIFSLHKITTGETSVVDLFLDDENIVDKLMPETVDGFISHFKSVDDFWIQKSEDVPKIDALIEEMSTAPSWPTHKAKEDNQFVAALYSDDGNWYRAKILEEKKVEGETVYSVQFIDFGNTTETSFVRMLTDEIHQQPPLATNCKLDPLPGYRWTEESSEKLMGLSNNGETTFQIEFVSNDTVRLYLNGEDIRSNLGTILASSVTNTPKKGASSNQSDSLINENLVSEIVKEIYTNATLNESEDVVANIVKEIYTNIIPNRSEDVIGDIVKEIYSEALEKLNLASEIEDIKETSEELLNEEMKTEDVSLLSNEEKSEKDIINKGDILNESQKTESEPEPDKSSDVTEISSESLLAKKETEDGVTEKEISSGSAFNKKVDEATNKVEEVVNKANVSGEIHLDNVSTENEPVKTKSNNSEDLNDSVSKAEEVARISDKVVEDSLHAENNKDLKIKQEENEVLEKSGDDFTIAKEIAKEKTNDKKEKESIQTQELNKENVTIVKVKESQEKVDSEKHKCDKVALSGEDLESK